MTCPKCERSLTYQAPVRSIPAPLFFLELSGWLGAFIGVGAFVALGLSQYWLAAILGAVGGLVFLVKLERDTEHDPAEGLYVCAACKRYFRASSLKVPVEAEVQSNNSLEADREA